MCGIVAAVARRNVVPILLEGLRRLEYRGYDSAGVAVINGSLKRVRSCGRVAELKRLTDEQRLEGTIGIGHTRWATHGAPSEKNAHPHISGGVSVVHNGIIENHEAIRAQLRARGYEFTSDTDTEVIAHLIHSFQHLALFEAVQAASRELKGAYAIAVIAANDPARLVVARMGAPLLLGLGDGENFAASDTGALLQVTRSIVYLEDGDCAEVTPSAVRIASRERLERRNAGADTGANRTSGAPTALARATRSLDAHRVTAAARPTIRSTSVCMRPRNPPRSGALCHVTTSGQTGRASVAASPARSPCACTMVGLTVASRCRSRRTARMSLGCRLGGISIG